MPGLPPCARSRSQLPATFERRSAGWSVSPAAIHLCTSARSTIILQQLFAAQSWNGFWQWLSTKPWKNEHGCRKIPAPAHMAKMQRAAEPGPLSGPGLGVALLPESPLLLFFEWHCALYWGFNRRIHLGSTFCCNAPSPQGRGGLFHVTRVTLKLATLHTVQDKNEKCKSALQSACRGRIHVYIYIYINAKARTVWKHDDLDSECICWRAENSSAKNSAEHNGGHGLCSRTGTRTRTHTHCTFTGLQACVWVPIESLLMDGTAAFCNVQLLFSTCRSALVIGFSAQCCFIEDMT